MTQSIKENRPFKQLQHKHMTCVMLCAIDESVEQVFSKVQTTSAAIEQITAISNELTQTMSQLKQLSEQVMQRSNESII